MDLFATADDTRYNSTGWGSEPVQSINTARYSIDQPPWVDATPTHPLSPVDGSFDEPVESLFATIDTSSLSPGRHIIFLESQDVEGNWGVPGSIFFWITADKFQPALSPSLSEGSGSSGSPVLFQLNLSNMGSQDDTFELQISGSNWEVISPQGPIGPVPPQGSIPLSLQGLYS